MAVQTQIQTRRGTAASWTSTNPTLAAGEIGFETDTGKFKIGNGSTAWAALAYSAGATAVTYLFNATSGQTTFSGADANGLTLAYTVGAEQVYLNGVLQVRGSDYTASNGTSIVLTSGALTSDVLNVIAYSAMTITDTYTQAQSDARFVQQSNNFFAGKNKIINGDFGVWQRGTSFTVTSNTAPYTTDRFTVYEVHSSGTCTVSRQTFTPGTAPVAGYEGQYFLRAALAAGASTFNIAQPIEDVRTFAGQTVTFSFWAKATSTVTVQTYLQQIFGSGGSTTVNTTDAGITIGTSWARYTTTIACPSVSGKTIGTSSSLNVLINYLSGTVAGNTIDTWGWQIEAGSIATPFQTATGTLAGELAACQRYYYRQTAVNTLTNFASGTSYSTGDAAILIRMPVTMRTTPTAVDYSTLALTDYAADFTISTISLLSSNSGLNNALVTVAASGLTNYRGYALKSANSANGYLGLSAEL